MGAKVMDMWIQLHDFSSSEKNDVSVEQAKEAFSTFDWKSEIDAVNKTKKDTCDAGIGLVTPDQSILHICPIDLNSCYVFYSYKISTKLLGFIPTKRTKDHWIDSLSFSEALKLIEHHFNGDREAILKTH